MASSNSYKTKKKLFGGLKEGMMAPETSFFIPGESAVSKENKSSKGYAKADQSGLLKLLILLLVGMMGIFALII